MKRVGIVGGGIGALHLGLYLRTHGIPVTLYTDKTASQQRAARLSNVVCRSAPTRERERWLGVSHWDDAAPDLATMSVSVAGPTPLALTGALTPPAQAVDTRIYTAALLDDFALRGGVIKVGALSAKDVAALSIEHTAMMVGAGRGLLANLFPRVDEHSPYAEPQRLVVAVLCRGIRYPAPLGFEVAISRGNGEILSFPLFSFQQGLTGLGVEVVGDGAFAAFGRLRYEDDPPGFECALLDLVREHAPRLYARVDPAVFGVARPVDVGHVAITPVFRRGYTRLSNGRFVLALGDAHVVMDPVTGQGANTASHAAFVLGAAIRDAATIDEAFCQEVEQRVCEYALPVSDACDVRLRPPMPHVEQLLGAASRHHAPADLYTLGFQHPDRFWPIISSAERTGTLLRQYQAEGARALEPYAVDMRGRMQMAGWT